ncbi:hypothetical protein RvY_04394-2 [Ramazzottius varieornatus]|uniref:Major facilitator superfamily (MFS) profile domain-containing protein n=1 Tax=Ramazzottius varieornatus TaxID=947166 RepID=A0A1D1URG2_RAMVA|nr:hypothetical protein RvY_04394-2 [Ramazzottius varieornatus]
MSGRVMCSVPVGINTALPPVYLNEISPRTLRGAIGAIHPFAAAIGLLVSRILGLPYILGNEWGWPILLAVSVIPMMYQLVAFPFCPESPRYLFVEKSDESATRHALQKLRNTSNVDAELADFQRDHELSKGAPRVTIGELFKDPFLRKTTFIAIGVMVSQHLTGVIAVMYYSTAIFKSAGLVHGNQAIYGTIGLGVVNVVMTLAAVFLVEKTGRKRLLLIGLGGSIVFMSLLVVCTTQSKATQLSHDSQFLGTINPYAVGSTISLVIYSIFVSIGPAAIPNLLVSELFATAPRAAGSSVAVGVNRITGFAITLAFPYIKASIEEYTFVVFVVTLAVTIVFTKICVIETKGKTTEEIQYELRHGQVMSKASRHSTDVKPGTRDVAYYKVQTEEKL